MIPPFHPTDPRANRAALQEMQAAHGGRPTEKRKCPSMPSDPEQALTDLHEAAVEQAVKRARDPETFARLLARAAELVRPATPTPEVNHD
jgi:hypothetical protein